jgi:hypothetical protein
MMSAKFFLTFVKSRISIYLLKKQQVSGSAGTSEIKIKTKGE